MTTALLLTVSEVADLLGFSRWKITWLLRNGQIKFIPLGRIHKRIARTEVDDWIRRNQVTNGPQYRKAIRKGGRHGNL